MTGTMQFTLCYKLAVIITFQFMAKCFNRLFITVNCKGMCRPRTRTKIDTSK